MPTTKTASQWQDLSDTVKVAQDIEPQQVQQQVQLQHGEQDTVLSTCKLQCKFKANAGNGLVQCKYMEQYQSMECASANDQSSAYMK